MNGQWYAAVRDVDVTQISGTGVIGWVVEAEHGFLMFWDTVLDGEATETVEWFRNVRKFEVIHGHQGCTRLVPVEDSHADRGRELMGNITGDVVHTFADLCGVLHRAA